jgi:signal transduction histidine kinase
MDVHDNTFLVIDVTDNGEGMTREVQARLFEPFFTTRHDGTGLGLSTVRAIVEEAGGRLAVRSERGHGTTFSIYWPLACVMDACDGSRVQ